MQVIIKTEISKYLIIATLSATLPDNWQYRKSYEQQKEGESKNLAEVKALLLACRHLNQKQDLKIEINTSSAYIKMCLKSLDKWQQSDWITCKGKTVKYKELWQEIYKLTKNFVMEVTEVATSQRKGE